VKKNQKEKNNKMLIKKGDTVIVLAGKDKGKKGKVLEALPQRRALIVERMNVVKRHQKATRNFQGGIIEKTLPLAICKVMLVCPRCGEPARVNKKESEGKMLRACRRCGEMVDKA
jgi:large subunit ribosomal protein L24